jgi:hypothetical protein
MRKLELLTIHSSIQSNNNNDEGNKIVRVGESFFSNPSSSIIVSAVVSTDLSTVSGILSE